MQGETRRVVKSIKNKMETIDDLLDYLRKMRLEIGGSAIVKIMIDDELYHIIDKHKSLEFCEGRRTAGIELEGSKEYL
jgi:hypothetical protein